MSKSIELYHTLPNFLKQIACSFEGKKISKRRYDSNFHELLHEYNQRLQLSKTEFFQFRNKLLVKFIKYAIENIPYYSQIYKEEFQTVDDLSKLPILSKEIVRTNSHQLSPIFKNNSDNICSHTSGTTGAGLVFPVSKLAEKHQWATWWRYRNNLGIAFKTKCGIFTGQPIVASSQNKPPYWMQNKSNNEIIFSGYHLHQENIADYVNALNKFKVEWLHGYPSNIAMLSKLMNEQKISLNHKVKFITTGAESLLTSQRNLIESTFQTKVFNHYGLAEGVANISECKFGNLHIDEDFSFVELLPLGDNKYKIIGTNFHNKAFPLLRYDTCDIATIDEGKQECLCLHKGRIISSIDGRIEDYIYLLDGTPIGRLDHLFKDLTHVKLAQIYQSEIGQIEIRIVKDSNYTEDEEKKLISEITMRMGNKLNFKILYVDKINKTKSGKFRFIVSDINTK